MPCCALSRYSRTDRNCLRVSGELCDAMAASTMPLLVIQVSEPYGGEGRSPLLLSVVLELREGSKRR